MTVHIFSCSIKGDRFGLTEDRQGSNLPADACKGGFWRFFKTIYVEPSSPLFISGITPQEIIDGIKRDGYVIYEVKVVTRFEERG
jgi:hypothetical protein